MKELIVLGLVPGTNIQISFLGWIIIFSTSFFVVVAFKRRFTVRSWILAWYVAHLIRRYRLAA
ncbi:MAG: hypothetical protein WC498_00450 [Candidatus Saccharimonadales bacterium]